MHTVNRKVISATILWLVLLPLTFNYLMARDDLQTSSSLQITRPITLTSIKGYSANELASEIEYHDKLYWDYNQPEISDIEYDILVERLTELNPNHSTINKNKSAKVSGTNKVLLKTPMLSLQKTYYLKNPPKGKKSLIDWLNKVKRSDEEQFLIQPKYDGISALYKDEVLSTRGDGIYGINVTNKIPIIELETQNYRGPLNRNARGEIIFRKDEFKKYSNKIINTSGQHYKTPRNAVAGIMNLKNIESLKQQGVKLTLIDFKTYSYKVSFESFVKEWPRILKKIKVLPYPIDGIVVKLADEKYKTSLGNTAHHPRGEIAYKFSNTQKFSKLIDIKWSFGVTAITPVAIIEPIEISGATISQVSMHNMGFIENKDLQIGDELIIERAGDVIPIIVDSIPGKRRSPIILKECPSCHSKLIRNGNKLQCKNKNCIETKIHKILKFVRAIGIKGVGPSTVQKLVVIARVKNFTDLFNLSKEDISAIPGFTDKSAARIYKNILQARGCKEYQLLAALNIKGVGKTTAINIIKQYSIKELLDMTQNQIELLEGVGNKTAANIYEYMQHNRQQVVNLLKVTDNS